MLEWRQFRGSSSMGLFAHRLVTCTTKTMALNVALQLGDRAWHREFLIRRGKAEVFTDLRRIQDWVSSDNLLPAPSPDHLWRQSLEQDLAADLFILALDESTRPAIGAGVLRNSDADTIIHFARSVLKRPKL